MVAHGSYLDPQICRRKREISGNVRELENLIKRYVILPRDFSQEEGEVTPTLKLRRRVIHEHFADEIEKLYAG